MTEPDCQKNNRMQPRAIVIMTVSPGIALGGVASDNASAIEAVCRSPDRGRILRHEPFLV